MNRFFVAPRVFTAICGLAVLLLLVACGGNAADGSPPGTPPLADPTDPIVGPNDLWTRAVTDPPGVDLPHPDFFSKLQLCGDEPALTPLQFDAAPPDPNLPGVPGRLASYRTDLGQEWKIVVRAGSAETLNAFTTGGMLKICVESLPQLPDLDALIEQVPPFPDPSIYMLLVETLAQTNVPAVELSQRSGTPLDIITQLGGSSDAVADAVVERIKEAQQAGNLAGVDPDWLVAFEADPLSAVNTLLNEPDLFEGIYPLDIRPLAQILVEEQNAVAIEILPAGQLAEDFQMNGGVIAYVIDPNIAPGAPHYYVAHCATYAYAQASLVSMSNNGTLALVLRKIGSGSQSDTASAAAPTTDKLEGSNRTAVTFDVEVSATQTASYTIAGNWVIGAGGVCANQ